MKARENEKSLDLKHTVVLSPPPRDGVKHGHYDGVPLIVLHKSVMGLVAHTHLPPSCTLVYFEQLVEQ